MAQPLSEYFALEAGEFLDQLDALLASSERPDPMRFFRLARGVRGSAQLAGATAIAEVAERLEDGARAIRDGALPWSPEVRDRARATAGDLRALVIRFGADWSAADDERARAAADRWTDVAGGRRETGPRAPGDELFGFVQREITGVVAELDRVLGELRGNPEAREPLRVVLRRMRPVRGVAGMEVLAPVLEGLEGIEDAAHEILGRASAVSAAELELLGAARDALDAAGRTLANGEPPGDSAELVRMRELRDRADDVQDAGDTDVVPISRLFEDGGVGNLVSSPMAPVPGEGGGASPDVEQFLRIEGTGFLDRAEGLLASLPARPRRFGRIAREVAELAASVRELATTYGVAGMSTAADLAATRVAVSTTPDEAREALRTLRYALPGAPPPPAAEPVAAPAVAAQPAEPSAPVDPPVESTQADAEEDVVPVETLLYDPADAFRVALTLRGRIEQLAAGEGGPALTEALDELFGLVQLAMGAPS
ncbi:Hpt domain-containing protein [Longimicrobium sp.]|jgi:HPt (histidine-containing phosphotransfer) domain-containing protein|uniref:Hpt domain-containing protein n=1 Tax=Longimicrobium sp. TaxID=2029185 RepID=UPI002F91D24E